MSLNNPGNTESLLEYGTFEEREAALEEESKKAVPIRKAVLFAVVLGIGAIALVAANAPPTTAPGATSNVVPERTDPQPFSGSPPSTYGLKSIKRVGGSAPSGMWRALLPPYPTNAWWLNMAIANTQGPSSNVFGLPYVYGLGDNGLNFYYPFTLVRPAARSAAR